MGYKSFIKVEKLGLEIMFKDKTVLTLLLWLKRFFY